MAKKPLVIDILQEEIDQNLPNWLAKPKPAAKPPVMLDDERRQAIRNKHRNRWLAEQKAEREKREKSAGSVREGRFEALVTRRLETAQRLLNKDWDESEHPRDEDGKFAVSGGGSGSNPVSAGFVSPSVDTGLDFKGAVKKLSSRQQKVLHEAAAYINDAVGIKERTETSIIGAWTDGAENSVMMEATAGWERVALATVMKGYLADQKSVLVFQQQDGGESVMARFKAKGELADIHKNLLEDGLDNHTIVPTSGGATVYVVDLDGKNASAIKRGASRYNEPGKSNKIGLVFGRAEFIGFEGKSSDDREQRDGARRVYEAFIGRSPVSGASEVWQDVRNRWSAPVEFSQGGPQPDFDPGIKASNSGSAYTSKRSWAERSPHKTADDLIAAAPAAQDDLAKAGERIEAKYDGVTFKNPGIKVKKDRIAEKIAERNNIVGMVTDVSRATFIVSEPKQSEVIAAELAKDFEVVLENWKVTPNGYMDRAANIRFKNGLIGELLFLDQTMSDAKSETGGNGHGMYVEWRSLKPSDPKRAELTEKMNGLYGKVVDDFPPAWRATFKAAER